jgi:outer membrane protein assembly factor BamB
VLAGALLLAALAVPSSGFRLATPVLANVSTGWTTYHYENAHDGNDAGEPAMTTLQGLPILTGAMDEKVQAEPLIYSGLVFAATENNTIYAFNESSATLAQVWKRNLAPQVAYSPYPSPFFCEGSRLGNNGVGITGTIDPATNVLYAVALTPDRGAFGAGLMRPPRIVVMVPVVAATLRIRLFPVSAM